jgi:hypothetical protein
VELLRLLLLRTDVMGIGEPNMLAIAGTLKSIGGL